jgi:hypothetical protein
MLGRGGKGELEIYEELGRERAEGEGSRRRE